MHKQALRKELQQLLTKYKIDKYTGLHNYMMSEHIVRWIEEYIREQKTPTLWDDEPQASHINYMRAREAAYDVRPNNKSSDPDPKG